MERKKYPKTPHLGCSPGASSKATVVDSDSFFLNKEIVITEKMDGECTGLTSNICHARSIESADHSSRHWVKGLHSQIKNDIPVGWKIFGENMFAKHTIQYCNLKSYFLAFNVWNNNMECLDWETTNEWFDKLGLSSPKCLYLGVCEKNTIKRFSDDFNSDKNKAEGFVVRTTSSFKYDRFGTHVAKWVKKDFIQTKHDWKHGEVTKNRMVR